MVLFFHLFVSRIRYVVHEIPSDQKSQKSTLDSDRTIGEHTSSPFVFLETPTAAGGVGGLTALGGGDKFCEWAAKEFPKDESIQALASLDEPPLTELFFDNSTPGGTWMQK